MKKNLFLLAIVSIAVVSCKTNYKQIDFLEFGWGIDSCKAVLAQHYDAVSVDTSYVRSICIGYQDVEFNGYVFDKVFFYGDPILANYPLSEVHCVKFWKESDTIIAQEVEAICQSITQDYQLLLEDTNDSMTIAEYANGERYVLIDKKTFAPEGNEERDYALIISYVYGEHVYRGIIGEHQVAADNIPLSVKEIPIQGTLPEFVYRLLQSGDFGDVVEHKELEGINYFQLLTSTSYFTFLYLDDGAITSITRVDYLVSLPTLDDFYQYAQEVSLQYPNYPLYDSEDNSFTWYFAQGSMTLLYIEERQGMTYIYNIDEPK